MAVAHEHRDRLRRTTSRAAPPVRWPTQGRRYGNPILGAVETILVGATEASGFSLEIQSTEVRKASGSSPEWSPWESPKNPSEYLENAMSANAT